jgi:hypothetical protein
MKTPDVSWFEMEQTRGGFLKKLGILTAAGAAAVLVPGKARATAQSNAVCCPADCGISCDPAQHLQSYSCQDSCSGTTCCVCLGEGTDCISTPCIC